MNTDASQTPAQGSHGDRRIDRIATGLEDIATNFAGNR